MDIAILIRPQYADVLECRIGAAGRGSRAGQAHTYRLAGRRVWLAMIGIIL